MGCSSNKEQTMSEGEEENKAEDNNNGPQKGKKKMKNVKIEITEDPELQGEKFHLQEKNESGGDKDSFDEF